MGHNLSPTIDFEFYSPDFSPSVTNIFLGGAVACISLRGILSRGPWPFLILLIVFFWLIRFQYSSKRYISCIELFPHGMQVSEKTMYTKSDSTTTVTKTHVRFVPMEDVIDVVLMERILSYKVIDCVMLRINAYVENQLQVQLIPLVSSSRIQLSRDECLMLLRGVRNGMTVFRQST